MLNTKPIRKNDIKTEVLDVVAEEKILDTIGIKTDKMDNNINNFKIDNVLNDNNVVEKAIAETQATQMTQAQPEVKHVPIPITTLPQYVPQQQTVVAPIPTQQVITQQPSFAPNVMSSYTVSYDDEKNSYTITYNGNIESIFTHKDIIDALNDANNANYVIRQYFFIISHNDNTGVNEINFVNSPVTTNIEIMIKIQNYLYELLNSGTDNAEVFDKLLFLYYQLIIYLFRNYARYENYPKIQKFYSTLSFRFSTLVLKQVVELGKVNAEMEMKIKQIDDVKEELILLASGILPQHTPFGRATSSADATNRTQTTDATQYTTENTDKTAETAETATTNKTLSELLSEATENTANSGLTGFVDNDATNSLITSATADGLTGFTDKNEFTSSQQLINKHGITTSNGQTVTNFDSIWNDDVSNPVSVASISAQKPAEITVETKGGKGKGKQQKEKQQPKPRGRPAKNGKKNNTTEGGGIVVGSKLSSSSTTSSTVSSTSASSSYTSNSDDVSSSSNENDLSPSYNEFSAKNNSRKIHVKL